MRGLPTGAVTTTGDLLPGRTFKTVLQELLAVPGGRVTGGSAPHEVGSIHCCQPGATTVTVALPLVSGFDPASIFLCCIGVSRLRCTVTVLYYSASEPCGDAPTPLIVPAFGQMLLIFPIVTALFHA